MILHMIFIGIALFLVVAALKRAWPHIPLLPGLFEDMANGYSYVNGERVSHRCYGCGADDPMGCGVLCADCSWEDHLASAAHTGSPFGTVRDSHPATPGCCMAKRNEADQRYRLWRQEYDRQV